MTLILYPDKLLRTVCQPVQEITSDVEAAANSMLRYIVDNGGYGLAAPQVGDTRRLFVTCLDAQQKVYINPEIQSYSEETQLMNEGCLSIPGFRKSIRRPSSVTIKYKDLQSKEICVTLSGLEAIVVQHEFDHLNGVLFVDHLPKVFQQQFTAKYGFDKYKV